MENASKALIIAGAILIAILLIGVAVMVMRGASAPIEQATDQASAQAIEMYNSKFTGYAGIQTTTVAKELLNQVIATNASNPNNQIVANVYFNHGGMDYGFSYTLEAGIKELSNYPQLKCKIELQYAQATTTTPEIKIKGYIYNIKITEIN